MSEPQTHADARAAIEELLDSIEDEGWVVVDYDPTTDPYDGIAVTATIEREPRDDFDAEVIGTASEQRERIKSVKDVVSTLEVEHDEGAHIDAVIDECADELDFHPELVANEIEKLRTKGEVYEPKADYLRTT